MYVKMNMEIRKVHKTTAWIVQVTGLIFPGGDCSLTLPLNMCTRTESPLSTPAPSGIIRHKVIETISEICWGVLTPAVFIELKPLRSEFRYHTPETIRVTYKIAAVTAAKVTRAT
mmetsp:Transcript_10763/g.12321  ORF Transcript_10763/g.12321 Transcript_10763/m.12321 type:complete len:115 (-) Transcript_10763:472-816(-)